MESNREAERYSADYGNLLLEISSRITEQERVFEFIVTDKADGFNLLERNRFRSCHCTELRDI